MQTQDLVLDIVPGGVPPVIDVTQYDTAREIKITLSSRTSASFSLSSNYTYELRGTRANKTGFIDTEAVSMVDTRTLIFTTTGTMTSIAGECRCGILIFDGEEHIETINFIMQVHRASLEAETVVNDQSFESIIKDTVEEVIDEQGLVIDDQLETPGAAADAKVTGDEIRELRSAIDSLTLGVDEEDGLIYIYINGVKQGEGVEAGEGGTRYTITSILVHATSSSSATRILEGKAYTTTITPETGYEVQDVTVTMGGSEVIGAYNSQTGIVTVANVSGDIVVSVLAEIAPIDLLNVTWANHAITCGQDTNNYNAWSPHNLQYDSVNDCFVFLQCHTDKHLNWTASNWTLSIINPYDSTDYEVITIPTFNGLGMLFVENGVWTLMPRGQSFAYRSSDMGETWETLQASIPQYLFGVYKCGDTYFGGDDKNSGVKYHVSSDLLTWTEKSFDSSLGYSTLCETTFCEFDGKYWAFNRTNDSTIGHPVILQSTDDGATWTLFSDQMLHGYRSTVSCYPFKNYIMVADIDRDNGVLYYNKFDGTTFTQINTWQMPQGGDDFHNVNIASNYNDTVILEFMHAAPIWYSGSTTYTTDRWCDNVMLVGSTKTLPSFNFDRYIDTAADMLTYANANLTTGLNGGTYSWANATGGRIRIVDSNTITTFIDEIAVPLNMMQISVSNYGVASPYFKSGDVVVQPWNNENGTGYSSQTGLNAQRYIGVVTISGIRYMYGSNGKVGELPVLIRAEYLATSTFTPSSTQNTITGETWQESLGFRRVISVNKANNGDYIEINPGLFSSATSQGVHAIALVSYTPVSQ